MIIEELIESYIEIDDMDFSDELKVKAGMVRASFGIYSTQEDVSELIYALKDIVSKSDEYSTLYSLENNGLYKHKKFKPKSSELFSVESFINDYLK